MVGREPRRDARAVGLALVEKLPIRQLEHEQVEVAVPVQVDEARVQVHQTDADVLGPVVAADAEPLPSHQPAQMTGIGPGSGQRIEGVRVEGNPFLDAEGTLELDEVEERQPPGERRILDPAPAGIPRVAIDLADGPTGDARDVDYSDGTVFYVYDTFRDTILEDMIAVLKAEAEKRTILVCSRGMSSPVFARTPWLERAQTRPVGLEVFRSKL